MGGEGGGVSSHAARSAETYCMIPFLTVRFPLWTNKGNAITVCLPLRQLLFILKIEYLLGGIPGPPTLCMKPCCFNSKGIEEERESM